MRNQTFDTSGSHERRQYFRIEHDIVFDFKPVDIRTGEHGDPEAAMDASTSMHLLSELRRIDKDLQTLTPMVADKQRLLGDYLVKLNSKIDLLARHTLFAAQAEHHTKRVSLSEGGVAFECDRALYKGNFLVLQIIFLPSYTPVITFAKVSRCDAGGDLYHIAAEFHRLRDPDRQELAKQVLRAQVQQRKSATKPETKI
jgi:PilZ domain